MTDKYTEEHLTLTSNFDMDRQTNGRYQTYYLPCFAVNDKNQWKNLLMVFMIFVDQVGYALYTLNVTDVRLMIYFHSKPCYSSTEKTGDETTWLDLQFQYKEHEPGFLYGVPQAIFQKSGFLCFYHLGVLTYYRTPI